MGSEYQHKLKRVQPIIRAKRAIVEKESLILAQLRQVKQDVAQQLQRSQGEYLEGVRQLNSIRERQDRQGQQVFEESVTFVREKWINLYRHMQHIDRQIDAQLHVLTKAQGQLKSVEKLEEKYSLAWRQHLSQKEQEHIDESATFAFNRKR